MNPSDKATPRWVLLARILRPRGNKGEVAAELLTDFAERLTKLREVYIGSESSSADPVLVRLESCWLSQNHRGQAVFHFANVASINEAEKFRGLSVFLPIEQRITLPAGHYFFSDLIGCSVFESPAEPSAVSSSPCSAQTAPQLLGTVSEVQSGGEGVAGTPILTVDTREGELLIPLAEDICKRIDTAARRIDVTLPPGLRDLNAPE